MAEPVSATLALSLDEMLCGCVGRWTAFGDLSDKGIAGLLCVAQAAYVCFETMSFTDERDREWSVRLAQRWIHAVNGARDIPEASRRDVLMNAFFASIDQATREHEKVAAVRDSELFSPVVQAERKRS